MERALDVDFSQNQWLMVSLKSSGNFGMGAMKKVQHLRDTPPIATLTKFPNHLHLHLLLFFKSKKIFANSVSGKID